MPLSCLFKIEDRSQRTIDRLVNANRLIFSTVYPVSMVNATWVGHVTRFPAVACFKPREWETKRKRKKRFIL